MNTVKDLREALADEVRRLQPPAGLERRIMQQALGGSDAYTSSRAPSRNAIRSREYSRRAPLTSGVRAIGAIAVVLIVVLVMVGIFLGGRLLRDWSTVPAQRSTHAVPRADSGMVSLTAGWWAGAGQKLQRTTDGGSHWSDVTPPSYRDSNGTSTYFLDATHAWIAETSGKLDIFRTTDGGRTWDRGAAIPGASQLQPRLYFLDAAHGWMVLTPMPDLGSSDQVMYGTSDGGLHWTRVATNHRNEGPSCNWLAPDFATPTDGWLLLSCISPEAPLLAVTHDGGVTWSPEQLPLAEASLTCPCTANALTVFGGEDAAVLIGGSGGRVYAQRLFMTADGGNSWGLRTLPGELQLVVDFVDPVHGWAIGGPSAMFEKTSNGNFPQLPGVALPLYRTDDGGLTWVQMNTNLALTSSAGRISDVYFVDLKDGFADRFNTTTQSSQLSKTVDGGLTWTVVGPEPA